MNDELIWKYITGALSEDEKLKTLQWIRQDKERMQIYHRLKRNFALTGTSHHLAEDTVDRLYHDMWKKVKVVPMRTKRYLLEAAKYAAVALVTLTVGWFLFSSDKTSDCNMLTSMETLPGQSSKVNLPDGTVVWLNSESKLTYSTQFGTGTDRDVRLQGEAYFDVTRNEAQPFRVFTEEVVVKVLGTSFNVEAYEGEDVVTTLVEGKVELNNQAGVKLADLQASQQAIFSASNSKMKLQKVDTEFYASWKDGYITFNNIRLEEIAHKLERFYNVDIEFGSERSKDLRINGRALRNVPVDHLFRVFEVTFGLQYEIQTSFEEKGKIYVY